LTRIYFTHMKEKFIFKNLFGKSEDLKRFPGI